MPGPRHVGPPGRELTPAEKAAQQERLRLEREQVRLERGKMEMLSRLGEIREMVRQRMGSWVSLDMQSESVKEVEIQKLKEFEERSEELKKEILLVSSGNSKEKLKQNSPKKASSSMSLLTYAEGYKSMSNLSSNIKNINSDLNINNTANTNSSTNATKLPPLSKTSYTNNMLTGSKSEPGLLGSPLENESPGEIAVGPGSLNYVSTLNPALLLDFRILSEVVSERYAFPLLHPKGSCVGRALKLLPDYCTDLLGANVVMSSNSSDYINYSWLKSEDLRDGTLEKLFSNINNKLNSTVTTEDLNYNNLYTLSDSVPKLSRPFKWFLVPWCSADQPCPTNCTMEAVLKMVGRDSQNVSNCFFCHFIDGADVTQGQADKIVRSSGQTGSYDDVNNIIISAHQCHFASTCWLLLGFNLLNQNVGSAPSSQTQRLLQQNRAKELLKILGSVGGIDLTDSETDSDDSIWASLLQLCMKASHFCFGTRELCPPSDKLKLINLLDQTNLLSDTSMTQKNSLFLGSYLGRGMGAEGSLLHDANNNINQSSRSPPHRPRSRGRSPSPSDSSVARPRSSSRGRKSPRGLHKMGLSSSSSHHHQFGQKRHSDTASLGSYGSTASNSSSAMSGTRHPFFRDTCVVLLLQPRFLLDLVRRASFRGLYLCGIKFVYLEREDVEHSCPSILKKHLKFSNNSNNFNKEEESKENSGQEDKVTGQEDKMGQNLILAFRGSNTFQALVDILGPNPDLAYRTDPNSLNGQSFQKVLEDLANEEFLDSENKVHKKYRIDEKAGMVYDDCKVSEESTTFSLASLSPDALVAPPPARGLTELSWFFGGRLSSVRKALLRKLGFNTNEFNNNNINYTTSNNIEEEEDCVNFSARRERDIGLIRRLPRALLPNCIHRILQVQAWVAELMLGGGGEMMMEFIDYSEQQTPASSSSSSDFNSLSTHAHALFTLAPGRYSCAITTEKLPCDAVLERVQTFIGLHDIMGNNSTGASESALGLLPLSVTSSFISIVARKVECASDLVEFTNTNYNNKVSSPHLSALDRKKQDEKALAAAMKSSGNKSPTSWSKLREFAHANIKGANISRVSFLVGTGVREGGFHLLPKELGFRSLEQTPLKDLGLALGSNLEDLPSFDYLNVVNSSLLEIPGSDLCVGVLHLNAGSLVRESASLIRGAIMGVTICEKAISFGDGVEMIGIRVLNTAYLTHIADELWEAASINGVNNEDTTTTSTTSSSTDILRSLATLVSSAESSSSSGIFLVAAWRGELCTDKCHRILLLAGQSSTASVLKQNSTSSKTSSSQWLLTATRSDACKLFNLFFAPENLSSSNYKTDDIVLPFATRYPATDLRCLDRYSSTGRTPTTDSKGDVSEDSVFNDLPLNIAFGGPNSSSDINNFLPLSASFQTQGTCDFGDHVTFCLATAEHLPRTLTQVTRSPAQFSVLAILSLGSILTLSRLSSYYY